MEEMVIPGTAGRKVNYQGHEYQLLEDIQVLVPSEDENWRYEPPIEPYAQVIRLDQPTQQTIEMNWSLYDVQELDEWAEAEDFEKCITGIIETDDD